jgi:TPR repeat protein
MLTLVGPARTNAGPPEDAATAYGKRDYLSALNLWRPLAEQGNAAAQRGLGILYENGLAVPQDDTQSVIWYRKAADQGDAEAEYRLGHAYVQGASGLPRDLSQGTALMMRAGDHGNARSLYFIGEFYRTGLFGITKDGAQAIAWYRKAADLGYALAESRLAIAYQFGTDVPKDMAQANFWYRKAEEQTRKKAEEGRVAAQLSLGSMYERGQGTIAVDKSAALFWYRKAAEQDGPLKRTAERDVARVESAIKGGQ